MIETQPGRRAVLLYGFLRTAELTSGSLLRNLAGDENVDIFYFGPTYTDVPDVRHSGHLDGLGYIKFNPKNTTREATNVNMAGDLQRFYGKKLVSYRLHDKNTEYFKGLVADVDRNEWLFDLDPSRFISMFYNMQGAYRLMCEYEVENGFEYDSIVLTRPDLSFYEQIDQEIFKAGRIYIPAGVGICQLGGHKQIGLSEPLFYVNRAKGTCIPRGHRFNDQVIGLKRSDAESLSTLVDDCLGYIKDRVPLTPETLLFYHFSTISGLSVSVCRRWFYEIIRDGDAEVRNIVDLMVLDIVDRYHPAVKRRAKERPLKYFLKFSLAWFRAKMRIFH